MKTMLFTPVTIGKMTLRNRISVPPMCMYHATDGIASDWHKVHYAKMASSGASVVCIEATAVTPNGRISGGCLGLWQDRQIEGFSGIVRAMRAADPETRVMVQLNHAGRKGGERAPWIGGYLTEEEGGWKPIGPSAVAAGKDSPVPEAMSEGGIVAMVQAFANVAVRARQAGVDAIQIHSAHGYLLHQFLSPLSNQRTDRFGGSFENRIRFPVAVFEAVKHAVPDLTVGVRVSATDWAEGGWNLQETIRYVKVLKELGCDFVDVSTGGLTDAQQIPVTYGYQLPFARAVRAETGLPTFAVGLIKTGYQAETCLVDGTADVVDVGREMLKNPHWGWQAALDLRADVPLPEAYRRGMR